MSVISPPEPKIFTSEDCEKFSLYYPVRLIISDLSKINLKARERFEGYSRRFIRPEEYVPGDFHQVFRIEKKLGWEETHVAYQTKIYDQGMELGFERLVYLQDLYDGPVGHGEIRFNPESKNEEFFKDKPFVGFTQTVRHLRGQGRGTDRLRLMNGLCRVLFDLPLHSDTFTMHEKDAEGPWKRLVKENKARSYQFGKDRVRYHFL